MAKVLQYTRTEDGETKLVAAQLGLTFDPVAVALGRSKARKLLKEKLIALAAQVDDALDKLERDTIKEEES